MKEIFKEFCKRFLIAAPAAVLYAFAYGFTKNLALSFAIALVGGVLVALAASIIAYFVKNRSV